MAELNCQMHVKTATDYNDIYLTSKSQLVGYDNTTSGLSATNVQEAVDTLVNVNTELTAIVNQKIGGSVLASMANIGQDVKEALTGGNTAIVGNLGTAKNNLASDLLNQQGKFVDVLTALENGVYVSTQPTIASDANYKSVKVACSANDVYMTDSAVYTTTQSIVQFYDVSGAILSQIGLGVLGTYKNYLFVVPANATSFSLSAKYAEFLPVARKYELYDNMIKTEQLDEKLSRKMQVAFDTIETDKTYNKLYPTGATLSGFNTYFKNCSVGDTYLITTYLIAGVQNAVVMFFDASGVYLGEYGLGTDFVGLNTDYKFVVPTGATKFATSIKVSNGVIPSLKKVISMPENTVYDLVSGNAFINFDGNNLYIKTKYDASYDLLIKMCKRGGNNLVDFDTIGLVANKLSLNSDLTIHTTIISSVTDWFSPYKVRAVNNINGDLPSDWATHFTGGNHQYNNTGSGSSATARCTDFAVICDGVPITNGSLYCKNIKVQWTNYIQGNNTKKADGTGREILKETITLNFDGVKFEVENNIQTLEDVKIETYYGLQNYFSGTYNVKLVGGTTRSVIASPPASTVTSGDKNCYEIKAYNGLIVVDIGIDKQVDIGDNSLNISADFSAFVSSYNKVYFNIIRNTADVTFSANNIYTLKGYYKFYKPI